MIVSRARILETALKKSGAGVNALLVSLVGKLLDSDSFTVAIALRRGADA